MFTQEEMENLLKAGRIGAEARNIGASLVKEGASSREICEEVEGLIIKRGAKPAFPCNLSINEIAAHYTPGLDDDLKIPGIGVVKIDVGAELNGYISDTATSVAIGDSFKGLVSAVERSLSSVVSLMKPNISIYDVGKTIEKIIKESGFRPIKNLTGHTISRYNLHAGESIPNYPDRTYFYKKLRPGTQVAIEPFGTTGRGYVVDGSITNIYSFSGRNPKNVSGDALNLLNYIKEKYKKLPFASRWLLKEFEASKVPRMIGELVRQKALIGYPVLIEVSKGMVAQFEHTFLVLQNEVVVTTK
ncbi:MAG: type II methionyl aminopeptidase [Caldisphaeraceae archaeon]|nr:type II methionyl aminopeptidase [Caldisphaeraceae archaeon]